MHSSHVRPWFTQSLRRSAGALIVCSALTGAIRAADSADPHYQPLITSAKANLDAGKLDIAKAELEQAVLEDPTQHDGFFYLAVVEFRMGEHASALEYARSALNVAKGDDKRRAQELITGIRKATEFPELERQADEAWGKGLNAKAADLYARAFEIAPERGDLGLRAATLYGNRLGRLLDAAVLYQGVIASGEAAAASTAGSELGALHQPLQKLYQEELARAVEKRDAGMLEKLSKAFPDEPQPRFEMAVVQAAKGDSAAVAAWLGDAVRLGTSYEDVKARAAFLDLWEKGMADFKGFIGDAFGKPAVDDMTQRLKARQAKIAEERRLAAEKARREDEAREKRLRDEEAARDKRLRDEQLAREEAAREQAAKPLRAQLRAPVVAELDRLFQAAPVKRYGLAGTAKFFGGTEKIFYEYNVSMALQGDGYVVKAADSFEHWKSPGVKRSGVQTFTVGSFASLTELGVAPVWDASNIKTAKKGGVGPIEKIHALSLVFSEPTVSVTKSSSETGGTTRTDGIIRLNAQFIINEASDAEQIRVMLHRLKAIDSMTLEQLRQKAGG